HASLNRWHNAVHENGAAVYRTHHHDRQDPDQYGRLEAVQGSREDDLYRHMRKSHGFSKGHMDALVDAGKGLEDWHHVDHHEYSRHSPEDLHSPVVHPQYEGHPDERERHDWKIPGAISEQAAPLWADPALGGASHPDPETHLTLSMPVGPLPEMPKRFLSSLNGAPPCSCCGGAGEHATGHECYRCDGGQVPEAEVSDQPWCAEIYRD